MKDEKGISLRRELRRLKAERTRLNRKLGETCGRLSAVTKEERVHNVSRYIGKCYKSTFYCSKEKGGPFSILTVTGVSELGNFNTIQVTNNHRGFSISHDAVKNLDCGYTEISPREFDTLFKDALEERRIESSKEIKFIRKNTP